jgi:hypothetical protein
MKNFIIKSVIICLVIYFFSMSPNGFVVFDDCGDGVYRFLWHYLTEWVSFSFRIVIGFRIPPEFHIFINYRILKMIVIRWY